MPRKAEPPEARAPHLDLDHDPLVEPVAARDPPRRDLELEVGLVLGHAPDPLAALDRDLGADWKVIDILTRAVEATEQRRDERRRRASAVGAGNPDRELNVAPDVGRLIVDHRDQEQPPARPDPHRVELVARERLGGPLGIDREGGDQGPGPLGIDRQLEGDAVDERVAPGLAAEAGREPHRPSTSSSRITGKVSRAASLPMNTSRWL
jgi:hypothetical protein